MAIYPSAELSNRALNYNSRMPVCPITISELESRAIPQQQKIVSCSLSRPITALLRLSVTSSGRPARPLAYSAASQLASVPPLPSASSSSSHAPAAAALPDSTASKEARGDREKQDFRAIESNLRPLFIVETITSWAQPSDQVSSLSHIHVA